jgi:hypothetical protein
MAEYFCEEQTDTNGLHTIWYREHFCMNDEIEEGRSSGLTTYGGLPTYLDLESATGFLKSVERRLNINKGGGARLDGPLSGIIDCFYH